MNNTKLHAIPTNIVTGFLGAGKTSAILHLLKHKPANERWAVLVNEFGEIGVDGSLIEGQINHDKNVFVQEVTGGCMCCSSGLTMQVALNQLLLEAKPHRLLIEPTGLGHPIEVLQVLSNQYYKDVLNLEKIITLVDARNVQDKRYTEHEVFKQQLLIADIIVGSKLDLYSATDNQALTDYIGSQSLNPESIVFIKNGQLPLNLLAGKASYKVQPKQHKHKSLPVKKDEPIPESGYIKAMNKGEGFQSVGWRFSSKNVFDRAKLKDFITTIKATRLKAVFITSEGVYSYNLTGDKVVENSLNTCNESLIEIICKQIEDGWEAELLNCVKSV